MMPRLPSRARAIAVLCAAGLVIPAGCGLPDNSTLEQIPNGDIPDELRTATTTTTTTTTTSPPEPPPTTTPPTTDPADAPVPVDVYFVPPGIEDQMFAFRATLEPPGSLDDVVELLADVPAAAKNERLRTAVRPDLISDWSIDRGTAEVDLSAQALEFMTEDSKRRAVAQIVLTFTSYAPPGEGGIGQIRFIRDGEPYAVITDQGVSAPGEGVAFEDFEQLIVNQPDTTAGDDDAPPSATAPSATTAG